MVDCVVLAAFDDLLRLQWLRRGLLALFGPLCKCWLVLLFIPENLIIERDEIT